MSKAKEFIQSLSDVELSFLFKYKYGSYMIYTRKLIDEEILERRLSTSDLEDMTNGPVAKGWDRCPRCGSKKQVNYQTEITNTGSESIGALDGLGGRASYGTVSNCAVCDFSISDPNHEPEMSIWEALARIFRRRL